MKKYTNPTIEITLIEEADIFNASTLGNKLAGDYDIKWETLFGNQA